jgi:hypothetical protein
LSNPPLAVAVFLMEDLQPGATPPVTCRIRSAYQVRCSTTLRGVQLIKHLNSSDFAETSLARKDGRAVVIKTFKKEVRNGLMQAWFSTIFYLLESVIHPVLVNPVQYSFLDIEEDAFAMSGTEQRSSIMTNESHTPEQNDHQRHHEQKNAQNALSIRQ